MDEPNKSAYTIYTIINNMNGRSRTGSFIAARGNIENDESVAGDGPDIVHFSIH